MRSMPVPSGSPMSSTPLTGQACASAPAEATATTVHPARIALSATTAACPPAPKITS